MRPTAIEGPAHAPCNIHHPKIMTIPVADAAHRFDDALAYDRFMARWSRAAGTVFLDWLAAPPGACWLDVGCGTGSLTALIIDTCSPVAVFAIDPALAQIDYARRQHFAEQANLWVADAQGLPFHDSTFDVVAAALVLNFIPDIQRALSEMRRVAKLGGIVGGYVWDFATERSPSWPLRLAMKRLGLNVPQVPGFEETDLDSLRQAFARAGFEAVATRSIDVAVRFANFDDFWLAQTPSYSPIARTIAALAGHARAELIETLTGTLPTHADGRIEYPACANAVKGRMSVRA